MIASGCRPRSCPGPKGKKKKTTHLPFLSKAVPGRVAQRAAPTASGLWPRSGGGGPTGPAARHPDSAPCAEVRTLTHPRFSGDARRGRSACARRSENCTYHGERRVWGEQHTPGACPTDRGLPLSRMERGQQPTQVRPWLGRASCGRGSGQHTQRGPRPARRATAAHASTNTVCVPDAVATLQERDSTFHSASRRRRDRCQRL